jgi:hypothetical protein
MRKNINKCKYLMMAIFHGVLSLSPVLVTAQVKPTFLYSLSNFSGKIPYSDVRLRVDRARDEIYAIDRGVVRIFNETGMEVYWFGDDAALGSIYDLAIDEKGDISLLSYDLSNPVEGPKFWITRCNYRGDAKDSIAVTGLPEEYSGIHPNALFFREEEFFLVSTTQMKGVVIDRSGAFRKGYDFARILEIPEKDRLGTEITGFSLDRSGNMLLTLTVLFKAFVVSPDGKVTGAFGKAGSAPGMFGIVGGIVADDYGNYLVVERLRSVVMVFDKEFRFLHEFGYRGDKPGNLIRPSELAVGNSGKLYVTQSRNMGVSVFSVTPD